MRSAAADGAVISDLGVIVQSLPFSARQRSAPARNMPASYSRIAARSSDQHYVVLSVKRGFRNVTTSQPAESLAFSRSQTVTFACHVTFRIRQKSQDPCGCDVVTLKTPGAVLWVQKPGSRAGAYIFDLPRYALGA
jgi:hypothetical protein